MNANDNLFDLPENVARYAQGCENDCIEEQLSVYFAYYYEILVGLLPAAENILDFGCAVGNLGYVLQKFKPGIHYVGADLSGNMVRKAQSLQPWAHFVQADLMQSPFPHNAFDIVTCMNTLLYLADPFIPLVDLYSVTRRFLMFMLHVTDDGPTTHCDYLKHGRRMPCTIVARSEIFDFFQHLNKITPLSPKIGEAPFIVTDLASIGVKNFGDITFKPTFYLLEKA
jgi:SAM-dependent methyltransferase